MNRLERVYLASPPGCEAWTDYVQRMLSHDGIASYDPWRDSNQDADASVYVYQDWTAIRDGQGLIARIPEDRLIVGVLIEVGMAIERGIPVVVDTQDERYRCRSMLKELVVLANGPEDAAGLMVALLRGEP